MSEEHSLKLPASLSAIVGDYDFRVDGFDSHDLSFALESELKQCREIPEGQRKAGFAEVAVFQFMVEPFGDNSPWGTRFAPTVQALREDGSTYSFPDIAQIDADVIDYWTRRAQEAKHPVLRAKYADAVWDLTKAATGGRPSIDMARKAIDSYIECGNRFVDAHVEDRLNRALELALSIRDKDRKVKVIDTMFAVLDKSEHKGQRTIWLYDTLCQRKGVELSKAQWKTVIDQLEAELKRICDSEKPVGIIAQGPAFRLAKHYERAGQTTDSQRVIRAYGQAVEKFAGTAKGMVAQHWLQEAYAAYMQWGLSADAEAIKRALKEKGKEAEAEMVRTTHKAEIPGEEMEKFLASIVADGIDTALTRVADWFCPRLSDIDEQLKDIQQQAKLVSMIPVAKMKNDQVIARAGSIEDDPVGRKMTQMADNIKFGAPLLGMALDRVREVLAISTKTLLDFLYQSPLFDSDRRSLVEQGLDAYLQDDHVKTIHVLVPQIEHILRRLLEKLGGATNKHRRSDTRVMIEKSLNDILESEPPIQQCLGDDITMYLRVFLCDPLGFNLRNDLAHGLLRPEAFRRVYSDRLVHILLLIGMFRTSAPETCENEVDEPDLGR